MKRRDSQRGRVYAAERTVSEFRQADFASKDEVRAYVRRIAMSRFSRTRRPGMADLTVRFTRGSSATAFRSLNQIRFGSVPHISRLLVLHEIAHILAPAGVGHSAAWVALYLQMTRRFLGAEVHARLLASFRAHKVKTRVVKPRLLSPEEKAVLADRMRQLRQRHAGIAA